LYTIQIITYMSFLSLTPSTGILNLNSNTNLPSLSSQMKTIKTQN
jgi:hypothetical protein